MKLTTAVTAIATSTVVGTPPSELLAKLWSWAVVCLGVPPEIWRTPPYSSAFMPSVVTIGITPAPLTISPVTRPAAIATANAIASATPSLLESPLG